MSNAFSQQGNDKNKPFLERITTTSTLLQRKIEKKKCKSNTLSSILLLVWCFMPLLSFPTISANFIFPSIAMCIFVVAI